MSKLHPLLPLAALLLYSCPAHAQQTASPSAPRWDSVVLNERVTSLLSEEIPGRGSLARNYVNETVKDAKKADIADDYGNRPHPELSKLGKALFATGGLAAGLASQSGESGTRKLIFSAGGAAAGQLAAGLFENTVRAVKASQEMTVHGGAVINRSVRRELRMGGTWNHDFFSYYHDDRTYSAQMPSRRFASAATTVQGISADYDIPFSGNLLSARAGMAGLGGPTGWNTGIMLAPSSLDITLEGGYSKLDGSLSSRRTEFSLGTELPVGITFPVTLAIARDDVGISQSENTAAFRDDSILLKLAPRWDNEFYVELSALWGSTAGAWRTTEQASDETVFFDSHSRQLGAAVGQFFRGDAGDTVGELKGGIYQDKNYTWISLGGSYYMGSQEEINVGAGIGINIPLKQVSQLHYYGSDGLKLSTIPTLWLGIKY